MFEPRKYRELFAGKDLVYFNCTVKETDVQIGACTVLKDEAVAAIGRVRGEIEEYGKRQPEFFESLKPLKPKPGAPPVVRTMHRAAKLAGVGPMAAVAGAIAEQVGRELLLYSPQIIVENGGDIFIRTASSRKIGIYAGPSPFSNKVALVVEPEETPLGISTSSGTFGHALSFGKCDAAVVLAPDAALSDAVATATANRVNSEEDVERAAKFASDIRGVVGVLVIKGDRMAAAGKIKLAAMS